MNQGNMIRYKNETMKHQRFQSLPNIGGIKNNYFFAFNYLFLQFTMTSKIKYV